MSKYRAQLNAGLSSLSAVETGVQHILADIMAKDINIITATRQWYVLFNLNRSC